jgi:hypothetical protein
MVDNPLRVIQLIPVKRRTRGAPKSPVFRLLNAGARRWKANPHLGPDLYLALALLAAKALV